ncbi:TPA: fimbrial protein, partial [Proteus mirabilis]
KPLTIELINCGNLFSTIDSKTWNIQFNGYVSSNLDSFLLTGPSRGLSIFLLDKDKSLIYPNKIYSLKNSVLRTSNKQAQLYLQFFLQLGLTGEYIQAGDYQGIISFFIDYQ